MLDHLDDLEADFRAIYHEERMMELPSATFLRLAERTFAYPGVMQVRYRAETQDRPATQQAATPSTENPTAQRYTLSHHGDVATVAPTGRSYLHDRLKGTP